MHSIMVICESRFQHNQSICCYQSSQPSSNNSNTTQSPAFVPQNTTTELNATKVDWIRECTWTIIEIRIMLQT
jgi:hypothetical protein